MLFLGAHFAEGTVEAVWLEQRIVAEALVAARREAEPAVDAALDHHRRPVRPGERLTFGELDAALKDEISHRARAFAKLKAAVLE